MDMELVVIGAAKLVTTEPTVEPITVLVVTPVFRPFAFVVLLVLTLASVVVELVEVEFAPDGVPGFETEAVGVLLVAVADGLGRSCGGGLGLTIALCRLFAALPTTGVVVVC